MLYAAINHCNFDERARFYWLTTYSLQVASKLVRLNLNISSISAFDLVVSHTSINIGHLHNTR